MESCYTNISKIRKVRFIFQFSKKNSDVKKLKKFIDPEKSINSFKM